MGKRELLPFFALFVFLVSHDCCVALPHNATGLSAVCGCGISFSHTHYFFCQLQAKACARSYVFTVFISFRRV